MSGADSFMGKANLRIVPFENYRSPGSLRLLSNGHLVRYGWILNQKHLDQLSCQYRAHFARPILWSLACCHFGAISAIDQA